MTLLADIESERRWAAAMDALRDAVGRAIDEARRIDETRPDASRGSSSVPVDDSVWDRLAQCESGQRWDIRNPPYSGGLQFMDATWRGHGGEEFAPLAYLASREEQIVVAERVLASQGWGAWPACSRKLGLR